MTSSDESWRRISAEDERHTLVGRMKTAGLSEDNAEWVVNGWPWMIETDAGRCRQGRRCQSRHAKSWVISGGSWLYCWECGAIRRTDWRRWVYPVGTTSGNPWPVNAGEWTDD